MSDEAASVLADLLRDCAAALNGGDPDGVVIGPVDFGPEPVGRNDAR